MTQSNKPKTNNNSAAKSNARALRIGVAVVLLAALLLSLIWSDAIESKFGWRKAEPVQSGQPAACGQDLNVHFVDVGQGDACVIELPDNRTMLIDAGENSKESKEALLSYIDEHIKQPDGNTITYFDFVILTHPDSDHCGGMYDVLSAYPAKTFYRPNVFSDDGNDEWLDPETDIKRLGKNNIKDTRTYDRALQAAYEGKVNGASTTVYVTDAADEDISVITPEGLEKTDPDYYTFTFYAPVLRSFTDWNDYSPVMILEYHEKRFMLSGDAEKAAEEDFVARANEGQGKYAVFTDSFTVDVFKLGHHGSNTSSSEAFIEVMTTAAARPDVIAIVSCGRGNTYHHPRKEVVNRLLSMGFSSQNILYTAGELTDPDKQENGFTGERGTVTVSVRGVEETGEYALFVGSAMAKGVTQSEGFALRWYYIVIGGCVLTVVILLILPELSARQRKAAVRAVQKGTRR